MVNLRNRQSWSCDLHSDLCSGRGRTGCVTRQGTLDVGIYLSLLRSLATCCSVSDQMEPGGRHLIIVACLLLLWYLHPVYCLGPLSATTPAWEMAVRWRAIVCERCLLKVVVVILACILRHWP